MLYFTHDENKKIYIFFILPTMKIKKYIFISYNAEIVE